MGLEPGNTGVRHSVPCSLGSSTTWNHAGNAGSWVPPDPPELDARVGPTV